MAQSIHTQFNALWADWNIAHNTGILYNPQGQAIVRHVNTSLTNEKGEGIHTHPQEKLISALFTFNF